MATNSNNGDGSRQSESDSKTFLDYSDKAPPDGGSQSLESSAPRQPTISGAFATIKPADFLNVHRTPCAREGLLTGIGAGGAVGVLRYILGHPVPRAANWAVGVFAAAAIGGYEVCQHQRRKQRRNVKRAVEVYQRKQIKALQLKKQQEEAAEEHEREVARMRAQRGWWKFW